MLQLRAQRAELGLPGRQVEPEGAPQGRGLPGREAQEAGEIDPAEDPEQLVFEIEAILLFANAQFVVTRPSLPSERARAAIARRLAA